MRLDAGVRTLTLTRCERSETLTRCQGRRMKILYTPVQSSDMMREVNHKQVDEASLVNKLSIGLDKWVFASAVPSGCFPDFV